MANELTYASISTLVPSIYDAALMHLRADNVMAATVRVMNDRQGLSPRVASKYAGGTFTQLAETDDMSAETWARSSLAMLTPAIYGRQFFMNDTRVASDLQNVMADAAEELGQSAAKDINDNLLGVFSSFTGGTIGSAGSTISWPKFFAMKSLLTAQKARPPYYFVCHTYQWHVLATSASTSGVDVAQPNVPAEMLQTPFSIMAVDNVMIISTPDITIDGSDDAYCGMYARNAVGLDIRRAFRINPQRDESRGGGGTELNASMVYAYGVYDASQGITGIFDAPTPS